MCLVIVAVIGTIDDTLKLPSFDLYINSLKLSNRQISRHLSFLINLNLNDHQTQLTYIAQFKNCMLLMRSTLIHWC